MSLAGPGDEVLIREGLYRESVSVSSSGASGLPITLASFEDENVVMEPSGFSTLYFQDQRWITVRGIGFERAEGISAVTILRGNEIRFEDCTFRENGGAAAFYVDRSTGVAVEDCVFLDNSDVGAYFRESSGVFARNSLTRQRGTHALVLEGPDTAGFQITDNVFTDNYPSPIRGHSVLFVLNGGPGIVIERNTISNTQVPAPTGAVPSGDFVAALLAANTNGIIIRKNTVMDIQYPGTVDFRSTNPAYFLPPEEGGVVGYGIQANGTGFDTVSGVVVEDNLVSNVGGNGINLASVDGSTVAGNLVGECGAYGIFVGGLAGDYTRVTGNVVRGNRVFENGWLHGGASGIAFWQAGPGNIARDNIAWMNRQGTAGRTGYNWFADGNGLIADIDSDGTIFVNNVAFDNEGAGIVINESDNCVAVHNTLVGNGYCPHWEDRPGVLVGTNDGSYSARNAFIANNLMVNNREHQLGVYAFTSFDQTIFNNLYAAGGLTSAGTAGAPVQFQGPKSLEQWRSMWGGGINATGAIEATPSFSGGDSGTIAAWALNPGSPGRGSGAPVGEMLGKTFGAVTFDANGAQRKLGEPNIGAVETFPGGFVGIESLVIEAVFPNQWVAVNIWDYGDNRWILPEHRLVQNLSSLEVRNLSGSRWYGISIWSYAESRWYGLFVSLLNGSFMPGAPTLHPTSAAIEGPAGIRNIGGLELRCADLDGAGWVANGFWSDRLQSWLEPLTNAREPDVFSIAGSDFPSGPPDDWFWAGMWHFGSGDWAPGSWIGIFEY